MTSNNVSMNSIVNEQFTFLVSIVDNYKNWVSNLLTENNMLKEELHRTKESLAYFQGKHTHGQ